MAVPCPTCLTLDCFSDEDQNLYSIESPLFPFVIECPPGYDCSNPDSFQMVCCGQVLSAQFPPNATVDDKQTIIQEIVNQCGVRMAFCGQNNNPNDPHIFFYNRTQTCTVTCPDGSPFVFTVAAGTFAGPDQATVDKQAADYACVQAGLRKICLGSIVGCTCVGSAYSSAIPHSGGIPPFTWSVFGGSFPPGLSLNSPTGVITGTPTTNGTYNFSVRVTCADGSYMTKPYSITILEITTTAIPGFTINTPFSFQMMVAGGSGNYVWSIAGGSLPTGLSMSGTGLISGTPTVASSSSVIFQVADSTCEAAHPNPTPLISLTGSSTTQIATILGYSEFPGFESVPPKKFKIVSWSGSSEQQLWNNGVQIGGARLDFGGIDQIDINGNVINSHTKGLSVMCNGAQNRANLMGNTYPQNTLYSLAAPFLGYFGMDAFYPNLFGPTRLCSSSSIPYEAVGDKASTTPLLFPLVDAFGLWGSGSVIGTGQVLNPATAVPLSNTIAACNESGTYDAAVNPYCLPLIPPGIILETFSELETPQGIVPRPPDWASGSNLIFNSAFSVGLQDEYTDAEALAVAKVIKGNGTVAQNLPRTTGFVSSFTSVNFTLTCTNLVDTKTYQVSVDFADLTAGTLTTKQYTFTADPTLKKTITDTIPTPPSGHSVVVRNPRISLVP